MRINLEQLPAHLRAQLVGTAKKQAAKRDGKKNVPRGVPLFPGSICESYRDRMFPKGHDGNQNEEAAQK